MKFLIIDQDTTHLRKLRSVLSKEGFEIITATNEATASDIISQMDINYVITSSEFIKKFLITGNNQNISKQ